MLVAARRIYQTAGFTLMSEQAHRSSARDLVGQTWQRPCATSRPNSSAGTGRLNRYPW